MASQLLTVFLPTFAVMIGVLVNRNDASRLDARITALDGRFHADMLHLIEKVSELEVRVAKLEMQRQ